MVFVNVAKDLCSTCRNAIKGVCPIYPPLRVVETCVEYVKRGAHPLPKK